MNKCISYSHQSICKDDINAVVKVLKSDFITQGPEIKCFENALCHYVGAKYAVCISSGTAALHIACLAAGIHKGDEVITSPLTFAASANCILYCGGKPVFADVCEDTANIDPKEIIRNITKKTKAVIPVHFAGHPCDLDKIQQIAKKNKLIVIEDAAHALGAKYKSTRIGACKYSDMAIFSFHPAKSLTTGEGGAVLTNRKDLYERLLIFRNHGITKDSDKLLDRKMQVCDWYYEMQELGFNYRMTDIQAALGTSQLNKLNKFIKRRKRIAKIYNKFFHNQHYFEIPIERKYAYSAYHLYPIKLKDEFKNRKKEIFHEMRMKRLGVQVHYIPVYLHPYYKKLGFKKGLCPNAESYYDREISIPIYPALKDIQIKYVINSIFKIFKEID